MLSSDKWPPLPGWSTIGGRGSGARRARLNASTEHFLTQVRLLRSPAVVIENVRGLAIREGGKHPRRVVEALGEMGYRASAHDVRAADFGVPPLRHRVFVAAVLREYDVDYELRPTLHRSEWIDVWQATGDLPSLNAGEKACTVWTQQTTFSGA